MNVTDSALAALLAPLVGASPEDLLAVSGRFAAFHWDEGFEDAHGIDWETFEVTSEHPEDGLLYCRGDFDLERSIFDCPGLEASGLTDTSLRNFIGPRENALLGSQLRKLVAQGRVSEEQREPSSIFGRIRGGETFLEAARALFMLAPGSPKLGLASLEEDEEDDDIEIEVEAEWKERIDQLFDEEAALHLSLFFHTQETARFSGGACADPEPDMNLMSVQHLGELMPGAMVLATWSLGEGQGETVLVQLPDEVYEGVPAFEGHSLLRKLPQPNEPVALDFMDLPPEEVLATVAEGFYDVRYVIEKVTELGMDAFMKELADEERAISIAALGGKLCQKNFPKEAVLLLEAVRPHLTGQDLVLAEVNRSVAYSQLLHFERASEAAESASQAFKAHGSPHVPEWIMCKNASWFAYRADDLDAAQAAAERAIELAPDEPAVQAQLGAVLLATGDEDGAREALDAAMSGGQDPALDLRASTHPVYREVALKHAIPVELTPEEAQERGL